MKETKVYVDRGLLSSFYTRSGTDLGKRKWVQAEIVFYNVNNIYLYDIKTHDRELVKEVCKKIKSNVNDMPYYDDRTGYVSPTDVCEMIDELQKEYEK